jgi:hypothetical protein
MYIPFKSTLKTSGTDYLHIKAWTPPLLQRRFWIPLLIFMNLLGIGLEIALYFTNKNKGVCALYSLYLSTGLV